MNKELRNDLIAGLVVALVFVGAYFIWINSPTVTEERAYQRQHAAEFLRLHQWDMITPDIQAVMKAYNISPEEIVPLDLTLTSDNYAETN